MHKYKRTLDREASKSRPITIEINSLLNNRSSCTIKTGNTHVICSATIEDVVPFFLKGQKQGWLMAEFNMLPCSTRQRVKRDISQGKINGRTQEIQRIIARSLRAALNFKTLGERQIIIDCDVVNADGGTRTAAITGGYVALHLAISDLLSSGKIKNNPIITQIAAISCGICQGNVLVDLDYNEDSCAEVDANFVLADNGKIVEIQASAEKDVFDEEQLGKMLKLAKTSILHRFSAQRQSLLNI